MTIEQKEKIKRSPIIAKLLRVANPSKSTCNICGLPWNHCEPHTIYIDKHRGCFAQCEYCYQKSNGSDVLRANYKLWNHWKSIGAQHDYTEEQFIDAIHRDLIKNGKEIEK